MLELDGRAPHVLGAVGQSARRRRWCSCTAAPAPAPRPNHRRFFDPAHYRIVIFDQRGAGRSTPLGELRDNTTPHLVADIETLRRTSASSAGWCSAAPGARTLALAYGEAHPERCSGLVLRGIFLCRKSEIDWFLYGLRNLFPEAWHAFAGADSRSRARRPARRLSPAADRSRPARCTCRRRAPGASTRARARRCCRARRRWPISPATWSRWASRASRRITSATTFSCRRTRCSPTSAASAASPPSSCRAATTRSAPSVSADDLHRAWPEAEYIIVPDAGHSAWEAGHLRGTGARRRKIQELSAT